MSASFAMPLRDPHELLSTRARTATSSAIRDLLRLADRPEVLSLAGGLPAPELFPVAHLHDIVDAVLAEPVLARAALQYGPTEGDDALRELLAGGPSEHGREVIITSGSQQALDLLARTLIDPGDVAVVENPSYLGALQAIRAAGATVVGIDGDADGLDTDQLAQRLAAGLRPKLCYVVANFANPTGATLSTQRRTHLVALAEQYGFVVIDDDPYGALRFSGAAVAPIDRTSDRVVSLGSASKVLAPGLRVGWITTPSWLASPLVRLKQAADLHTSSLAQMVVQRALGAEWFAPHVNTLCAAYGERAEALIAACAHHRDVLAVERAPQGGMFVWTRFVAPLDSTAVLPHALANGVAFVPGAAFSTDDSYRTHARLSFATLTPDDLRIAMGRLALTAEHATR